ncbi:MAG: ABC transporter ATP-binding protein [Actinomycetota bacterium]
MSLSTVGVTKTFAGLVALDGVSLDVLPGETVGLIGPNGAGKTTFFNCVTGFLAPDSGAISFGGTDLGPLSPPARARLGLARTFQQIRLFGHLSVRENLLLGRHRHYGVAAWQVAIGTPAARRAERAARAHVEAVASSCGLDGLLDARVSDLPYGTQRMVEVARALAMEPTVLLLDEPGAGMDAAESAYFGRLLTQVQEAHRAEGRELGLLLIEHDIALVASVCDRLYVLDFGRLIAAGTPAEVMADPAVRRAYLGSEASPPAMSAAWTEGGGHHG